MADNASDMLFEMAKQQDLIMHNLSGELAVKTSLYLVFSAFIITASIQVINLAKDNLAKNMCSTGPRFAMLLSALGAAIALVAGFSFLVAAIVRDYSVFPANDVLSWLKRMEEYRKKNPGDEIDCSGGLMQTLISTIDQNHAINEKKSAWIKIGTRLLFISLPFTAVGGFLAIKAYF